MAELTPLSHWLTQPLPQRVALRAGEVLAGTDLIARIDAWVAVLARHPGQRFALYHADAFEFLAILLALWQTQRVACIASDNNGATIAQLRDHVDGFIGEFDAPVVALGASAETAGSEPLRQVLAAQSVALEIYTSGSSGMPKAVIKTIAQLEAEIYALESLWPGEPGSAVLATVTHQHFYGLVIALLWPFSAGRVFAARLCEFAEEIIQCGSALERFTLVSSPSHLARLGPSLDWSALAGRCDYALSSAAPLRRPDSLAASVLLAAPVREIYGSTETGAIAWRCQQDSVSDALWQALPGARLAPDAAGMLSVGAPWLADHQQVKLPDRVEFTEGERFRLLGRADRIVKVEGKRVSLTAIETLLQTHRFVEESRALTLERKRVETAIVMRLSEAGQVQLQQLGRRAFIAVFRELLQGQLETLAIPRRWRFVEQMPYNVQGKLPLPDLQRLFEPDSNRWPQILDRDYIDGRLVMRCLIPPELDYFNGHMDGNPVLPGIVQIHWAEAFGRRWLPISGRFQCLEAIKFQNVVLPDYEVQLDLDFNADNGKLYFCYQSKRGVHSRGRICFTR
jgi:3-hydroxymyristoyl/3-hydroxydecanoyl-(acyl carrier protein) dehydratase